MDLMGKTSPDGSWKPGEGLLTVAAVFPCWEPSWQILGVRAAKRAEGDRAGPLMCSSGIVQCGGGAKRVPSPDRTRRIVTMLLR
jgi:hypothetical protein